MLQACSSAPVRSLGGGAPLLRRRPLDPRWGGGPGSWQHCRHGQGLFAFATAGSSRKARAGPGGAGAGTPATAEGTATENGSGASSGGGAQRAAYNEMLTRLRAWADAYGSCYVPSSVHDEQALAAWVRGVRRSSARLPPEQRQELDALGFVWKPHVVSFSAQGAGPAVPPGPRALGSLPAPQRSLAANGPPLGTWLGAAEEPPSNNRAALTLQSTRDGPSCIYLAPPITIRANASRLSTIFLGRPHPPTHPTTPPADSEWHTNYHRLRAWAEGRGGGSARALNQLAEVAEAYDIARETYRVETQRREQRAAKAAEARRRGKHAAAEQAALEEAAAAAVAAAAHPIAAGPDPAAGCDEAERHLLSWIHTQGNLYRAKKLSDLKVKLLRRVGVRLRHQGGGPAPLEVHPGLRFAVGSKTGATAPAAWDGKGEEDAEEEKEEEEEGEEDDDAAAAAPPPALAPGSAPPQQVVLHVTAATRRGTAVAARLSRALAAGEDVWRLLEGGPQAGAQVAGRPGPGSKGEQPLGSMLPSGAGKRHNAVEQRFMLVLSQLQQWYARYGLGAPVPRGVFDRPQLAEWVEALRAAAEWRSALLESCSKALAAPTPRERVELRRAVETDPRNAMTKWQHAELRAIGFNFGREVRGRRLGPPGRGCWEAALNACAVLFHPAVHPGAPTSALTSLVLHRSLKAL
jgi:hypothetical protein